MKKETLYEVIGEIDEHYIKDAHPSIKKKPHPVWMKWGAMAACLCLVVCLAIPAILDTVKSGQGAAGTLIGDTEIYPTVMVAGQLYEWRKGKAICDQLPSDCMYYGEITHVSGNQPA